MSETSKKGASPNSPPKEGEKIYPFQEEEITEAAAKDETEKFFGEIEEKLKDVPQEVIEAGAQKIKDFIEGKIGWADILNLSPDMVEKIAEIGYNHFKLGRYHDAERFFKVLTILDWENYYYHSMLGSIYQRQKRFGEAIVEYTQALETNPNDIVSLTNRGELFFQHGWIKNAKQDFAKAISLDPKKENKWANRARVLFTQLEKQEPSPPAGWANQSATASRATPTKGKRKTKE